MLVKDTLEKQVSVVVQLRGAVWWNLYPGKQIYKHYSTEMLKR